MNSYIENILNKKELPNYIAGFSGYRIPAPGLVPTNPETVFDSLKLLIENNDSFRGEFLEAYKETCKMPEYCWFSLYYLFDMRSFEKRTKIELISSEIIQLLASSLRKYKAQLEGSKEWEGSQWPNGLWGEVQRMNRIISESLGIAVLPEEL